MDTKTHIEYLPGIGKYYSFKLKRLDIESLEDLIYHFPFRYDDFSQTESIATVQPDQIISIVGTVLQIKNFRTRTGKFLTRASVADESGIIEIIWFNQSFLTNVIKTNDQISLAGKVKFEGRRPVLMSPTYEVIKDYKLETINSRPETIHTGRLVPVYPETEGVTSKWLRAKIAKFLPAFLENLEDFEPTDILKRQGLIGLNSALSKIHFPQSFDDVTLARKRLAFDELFLLQLASLIRKNDWQKKRHAPKMKVEKAKVEEFIKNLSFILTDAQKHASSEILKDLEKPTPANRLLEGEVGSGKTVLAALAAFVCTQNNLDTILAAPTEILAFQHYQTLKTTLAPYHIEVGIWTKSKKTKGRVTVGTHALLTSFKTDSPIGLVVVDEQHRFGVAQRAKLFLGKNQSLTPHLLTMTATPIPRTLALTLYGDLDLSVLDEMPKGRLKISTFVVPNHKKTDAYKFIEKQIKEGRQAFIIAPFVEPSESMQSVKAATLEFEKLKKIFPANIKLDLLHGRFKSKEKEAVIDKFKEGITDILVSTPVVEVGIDVPNATIMMIESADRFGLAQLHQLRGRVGRGKHKSYCLLFTDSSSQAAIGRLKSMEKVHIGFELAEIDLKMRGPGEMFGLKQSGFVNLKIADLSDHQAISTTQTEARNLFEADPELKKHPHLAQRLIRLQAEFAEPN